MWQYKSLRNLIRFSLFKYLGRKVCILTTPPTPTPLFGEDSGFLVVFFQLLRISCPLKFGYTHHLSRSVMFFACHAMGACMNLYMYMYRMHDRPHRRSGHLSGKLFCFATELILSDVVQCPSRSCQLKISKHDRFLGGWSVQVTNCVPEKWSPMRFADLHLTCVVAVVHVYGCHCWIGTKYS